jgi:hypothetical protein
MEAKHPEEIQRRLQAAGIDPHDYRQGPDLPSYLTLRELLLVVSFVSRYGMDGNGFLADNISVGIHVRDRGTNSKMPAPWVEFSVNERKFAIWRNSEDLYEVQPDGSIGDEPLHRKD